jgi:hypothetical protein
MSTHDGRLSPRVLASLAAAAMLAVGVGACGDDDSGDGDAEKVTITASGDGDALEFSVEPGDLTAGAADIELVNDTGEAIDGQLGFVAEERSDEEVAAEFRNAVSGRPVADWFHGGGGPGTTEAGQTGSVTQDLEAGTYYVLPGNDIPEPPLAKFTVSEGDDAAELPETDGKVTAVDYSFSGEGLTAGTNEVLLENSGEQWHHFLAAKLKDGATIEQAQEYLQSEGGGGGPAPFEGDLEQGNAIESTVMDGGFSQVVSAELEEGRYAFFCFIPDKQGGPPHVFKGMVSEVEVAG